MKVNWCELYGSDFCYSDRSVTPETFRKWFITHLQQVRCTKGVVGRDVKKWSQVWVNPAVTTSNTESCPELLFLTQQARLYFSKCVCTRLCILPSTLAVTPVGDGRPPVWGLTLTPQSTLQGASLRSDRENLLQYVSLLFVLCDSVRKPG